MFILNVVVDIKETESGFEVRGVEPKLRDFPAGRHYPDMETLIAAIIGGYLQPRGIRGVVSFDVWPRDTPSFDIQKVRELIDDPSLELLSDKELEQRLRAKREVWERMFPILRSSP